MPDPLHRYRTKRDFGKTPEPQDAPAKQGQQLSFVIQKHAATRLHYDFRLELGGVLLSWAVPKGPSFDPTDKRMAVRTEDHPLSYGSFEGTIPPGNYGAGTVIVWDHGTWEPIGNAREGLEKGKLLFELHGQKMAGRWELIRIRKPGEERQDPWLLFKKRDGFARTRAEYDVVTALPDSVIAKPPGLATKTQKPQPRSRKAAATARQGEAGQGGVPGAVKATLPDKLSPQLATLASGVPTAGDWFYEIKFDGYRLLTRVKRGVARLFTRNGHDWTSKMPGLADELKKLGLGSAWLDGEIVVFADDGAPDFNALQQAFDKSSTQRIAYFLFDLPYFEGYDLRDAPLQARRALLERLLEGKTGEHLRFSEAFAADAASVLRSACEMHLEGVIAKRTDAPYRSGRSETWLKLKCHRRQEFVVGGFTDRTGASSEVGSLLLGVHDADGKLTAVGSVGTGWDSKAARDLHKRLVKLESTTAPFDAAGSVGKRRWGRRSAASVRWVQPKLVVEVGFAEWTPADQIRHASFVGVRTDKPARAVTRERSVSPSGASRRGAASASTSASPSAASAGSVMGIKVSNPRRVIDPSTGLEKIDLVRYYESVADWILPHVKGRPVSLVRGPKGVTGPLFFQKHGEKIGIAGITELDPALWPEHDALLQVDTVQALLGAAQMNVIELHTWNSTSRNIDKPDRLVFDLDPGEGVAWAAVREAAVLTRALLQHLGLESWLKTSGGKGLHVVVPIAARWDYDTVKAFSQAVVVHLAQTIPDRFVAKSGPANRIGKIFADYLRNGHGATTAVAFTARARPGLGVSMPVSWEQLARIKSGAQWTITSAREHLSFQKDDPWSDYWKAKQSLTGAMKTLGFKPPKKPEPPRPKPKPKRS
ncbi:DNA ligase D [Methylibium sp.]|uniref:DNA ligase D n=1 Tax=Methylibium sp. TaxID=2067992 RepID=UPI002600EB7D|nr:DNA ligase D [Methylibium sp.]